MGLIQAAIGAAGSVLGDQWKEYFYCEALSNDTLVAKGKKKTSRNSSNKSGSDNVITDGSVISVADGQCMMIVEQGKVVEFSAEPGVYTYDNSIAPSIFNGGLGAGVKKTFSEMAKRFTFGGQVASDQRIYYFNTKEIMGNKYGTATPVPFRVIDSNIGLDVDISIRCNGEYSFRMIDPILFYTNVCGNVTEDYTVSQIASQLKTELLTALQPAFATLSEKGIRYSQLPGHTGEIADALNDELSKKWRDMRGIEVASFGVNSVSASKEDEDMIKQLQKSAVMRDPSMAAAQLVGAQSDAMRAAASNTAGAMTGFMGMGMAGQAGGMNYSDLFAMGQQKKPAASAPAEKGWTCPACGAVNTGKFCAECGAARPAEEGWTCPTCGAVNKGKFCAECGAKKPAGALLYKCDKCGWEPEDPANPPKFCPECGDPFDENDIQ